MVGQSGTNGMGPIKLLKGKKESHLVLKREGGERPEERCGGADGGIETIGSAHEESAGFEGADLDVPELSGEIAAGEEPATFVEDKAETALAQGKQLDGLAGGLRGLDHLILDGSETAETGEVFQNPLASEGEAGLTNCNDAPTQGGKSG